MHKNAFKCIFSLHMHTHAHIYTYLHTFIHEDTTILDSVHITMHTGT